MQRRGTTFGLFYVMDVGDAKDTFGVWFPTFRPPERAQGGALDGGPMRSKPVIGRKTSGTRTEPSACW